MRPSARPRIAILAAGLGAVFSIALLGAVFGGVTPAERARREDDLLRGASSLLTRDAARLEDVTRSVVGDRELLEIVGGGGAAVRPARLFALLAAALPGGAGWGIVLYDPEGRAVAWSGEAGDPGSAGLEGVTASFQVTRFRLVHRQPVPVAGGNGGANGGARPVLVASRTYPTGMVGETLSERLPFPLGRTSRRLRVAAAGSADRLVRLLVEDTTPALVAEDVRRARGLPWALAASAAFLAAALLRGGGMPLFVACLLSRLALLSVAPRAFSGMFRELPGIDGPFSGFVATPFDVLVSGLLLLLALGVALRAVSAQAVSAQAVSAQAAAWPARFAFGAAGLFLALLAAGLSYAAGATPGLPLDDIGLLPTRVSEITLRMGMIPGLVALLGLSALSSGRASGRRKDSALLVVCGALGVTALAAAGLLDASRPGMALLLAGTLLVTFAFTGRLARFAGADLLERLSTVVLLAGASAFVLGAGLVRGTQERLDAELLAARANDARPRSYEDELKAFEERISAPEAAPWLPAGAATDLSDLAPALWRRGSSGGFPTDADVLTLRSADGVLSSFGKVRPRAATGGAFGSVRLPVTAVEASFTRHPGLRAPDRDPLLVSRREASERPFVERSVFDAAGRARPGPLDSGPGGALGAAAPPAGAPGLELPAELAARARRDGSGFGSWERTDDRFRVLVVHRGTTFLVFATEDPGPRSRFATAFASAEGALPLLLLLLVSAWTPARAGPSLSARLEGPPLRSFRVRLVVLVLLCGAVPLTASLGVIQVTLERQAANASTRRALTLLDEARRFLPQGAGAPGERLLAEAAGIVGSDVLLYRDGTLRAASRAVPVAAGVAPERLAAPLGQALAEGRTTAALVPGSAGRPRHVEAAMPLSAEGRDALAVVVPEDDAGRSTVSILVLFAIAVSLVAAGLGGRSALALSRPLEDLVDGAEKLGRGEPLPALERPRESELARLVAAFEAMSRSIRERTDLLESERRTAVELVANLTAAVLLVRLSDESILLANGAAKDLLGSGDLRTLIASPGWEELRQLFDEARATSSGFDARVTAREGRVYRVVLARLDAGEGAHGVLVLEDVTNLLRAERLGAWLDATRSIAHDVKNPLTPIRLAAERLIRFAARGEAPAPATLTSAGETILRQVEILTDRISRLARFGSSADAATERLTAPDLERLLKELAEDFAGNERVSVRVEVDWGNPAGIPPVQADRALLRDVLANFLVNAVEALEGRKGTIVLGLAGGAHEVHLTCDDDGPGVPPEKLPRLFDPSFSTKSRGSGMGLAAAKRGVERSGGRVFAEPSPMGGLRIGFTLPAAPR